jgi:ammonia channel protein AmtB
VTFALLGSLLVWIFFPILALDYIDEIVAYHTPYTGAYSVIFSLCAATITSFLLSPLFNDGILIRDVIYGPIAGGVACSTASYWILNPVYAIIIGVFAGAVQVVAMNVVEKKFAR